MYCPPELPVKCASGHCSKNPSECLPLSISNGYIDVNGRLLQSNTTTNSTVKKADPGCATETPNRCYDGSCRADVRNCPLLPGCTDPSAPFRCPHGVCAKDSLSCP